MTHHAMRAVHRRTVSRMFADIAHGHATAADWLLLVAAVVAVLASLASSVVVLGRLDAVVRLLPVAVALVAVALLVLW